MFTAEMTERIPTDELEGLASVLADLDDYELAVLTAIETVDAELNRRRSGPLGNQQGNPTASLKRLRDLTPDDVRALPEEERELVQTLFRVIDECNMTKRALD